jgi:chromosome segregation ATPase
MAEKKIIELEVKNNLGSLKSQLREAQAEVAKLSEQFGVTSKEAANAAKRAAELKDQIEDAKALTDAFNPDAKFKALSSSLGGVASGFAAYQGALGLIGVESKEVEAQLLKVQSAMALAEGLQSLGGLKDSMIALASVVKNQVVTAFATLKGALMATGIGLVIAAIGTAIYLMDKYNDEIEDNIQKQKRLNEENKKYAEELGKVADARQKDRNASKGGLNDKERELQLLRARGASEQDVYKKEKEIINKRIFDQNVLLNTFIGNNAAEKQKRKEAQENLKNLYAESKSLDASYNRQLRENQQERIEDAQEKRKNANEKQKQAEKDFYENQAKMLEEAEKNTLKKKELEDPTKKAIRDARKLMEAQNVINEEKVKQIEAHNEAELRLEEDKNRKKQELTAMSFDVIRSVADLFAQGNEADQRKAFQLNKAASLGQAIVNTAQGVTAALTQVPLFPGAQIIQAGLVGTLGALNIAKIANTQFQSSGGGGDTATSTPTAPRTPSFDIIQAQPQMQLGALQQQPVKAYVVSGEVSTAQALDRNRVRNATF